MKRIVMCAVALVLASAAANAQSGLYRGGATVHVGSAMGGSVADPVVNVGGALSVQEDSGWGTELDFGFANDNKAGTKQADLTTGMVSVNWVRPRGPVHPYAMVGAGLIGVRGCLQACSKITSTWNFAVGGGGGVRYDLNDMFAVGGDVRYFMAPGRHAGTSRPENFGFFRAAFGVTFSWALLP